MLPVHHNTVNKNKNNLSEILDFMNPCITVDLIIQKLKFCKIEKVDTHIINTLVSLR
jgi:hypothetical protein